MWAIAAGAARLPQATWRAASRQAIETALAFTLSRRDGAGLWGAGTGISDDDWILSTWMTIALGEVHALPRSLSRDVDLGVVLDRVKQGDKVQFTAEKVGGTITVTRIDPVK